VSPARRSQDAHQATLDAQAAEWEQLRREFDEVRIRLADSEETLRAIRNGEVDALLVARPAGEQQVFTLASADRPYRNFVESMSDGAATVSAEGIVLYANQALAELVESSCPRIVGQPVLELVTPLSRSKLAHVLTAESRGGSVEATLVTSSGTTVPVLMGASQLSIDGETVTCLTVTDLTAERLAEAALVHSANHDALTSLPNRTLLIDRIEQALARRSANRTLTALFFCDVDGFKNINDAHGHQIGDDMLQTIAARLCSAVRPEDTVARIGGDEFVILCEGLEDVGDAALVASRLRASIGTPVPVGHLQLEVTISIGIAVAAPDHQETSDTLLRDADEAMYKAKRQGPNQIELFDEKLKVLAASRLALLSDLRHATSDGELRLAYQPILALGDEQPTGVEALIRWQHPTRGLVAPDEFIPFAERSGLIIDIGAWVLSEACRQAAAWGAVASDGPLLHMSVNISARQLAQGAGLVESVKRALEDSGIEPQQLGLEVTESALMEDAEAALRVVQELKSLGVQIAIDDFGTGYSSLLYLKRFPVDALKVDRSFVSGLGVDEDDSVIVRSVIELAHAFGIAAVAEGIETRGQLAVLQSFGCEYGQGYLWSPGRPAADLGPILFRSGTGDPREVTTVASAASA
jgi:diguanylate cyclase (GGDEF)-like protein/PAS domain S-box-containing protein